MKQKFAKGLALLSSILLLSAFLLYRSGKFDAFLGITKSQAGTPGDVTEPGRVDKINQVTESQDVVFPSSISAKQQPPLEFQPPPEMLTSSKSIISVIKTQDISFGIFRSEEKNLDNILEFHKVRSQMRPDVANDYLPGYDCLKTNEKD